MLLSSNLVELWYNQTQITMETKKKFYQTDTFKYAVGLAVGALLYKIVTGLFF